MSKGEQLKSDAQAAAIAAGLAALALKLEIVLRNAAASGMAADNAYLLAAQAKIAMEVATFQATHLPVTREVVLQTFKDSADRTTKTLKAAGLKTQAADNRAAQLLADQAQQKIADASLAAGRKTEEGLRRIALNEISGASSQGDSVKQSADRVLKELADRGMISKGENGTKLVEILGKDGKTRNYQAEKYAKMVVRTTAREAHTAAVKQQMLQAGLDLVEVSSHDSSCDICGPYDGNVYSISGNTAGYDVLNEEPPFHPNCSHVLTPGPLF